MGTESQNAQLLAHLKLGNTITFFEAVGKFGVMHLPRRMLDLKEAGHNIQDDWVKTPNGKRFKKWWLGS